MDAAAGGQVGNTRRGHGEGDLDRRYWLPEPLRLLHPVPATCGGVSQYAQVYIYDPRRQIVGLDQSNAGEPNVLLDGPGGPFKLSKDVVIKGGMLTDCSALPTVCSGSASG